MEKAILKTLNYYDIFDYPLKAWEIHKWLIGKSASLKQVEKTLNVLIRKGKVNQPFLKSKNKTGLYCLPGRNHLIRERFLKEQVSSSHFQTVRYISKLFKVIPWIKLVGVSGSLAMMGSSIRDDIDLFIVTADKRIWVTRLFLIILTSLTGLRRKRREKVLQANGKLCINLILEESNLGQNKKNIYVAHEILQMRLLWQRNEIYSEFLHANDWAFKYLPNWKSSTIEHQKPKPKKPKENISNGIADWLEEISKRIQLKIMGNPDKSERIETGALYFHPEDKGVKILESYKKRLSQLNAPGHSR